MRYVVRDGGLITHLFGAVVKWNLRNSLITVNEGINKANERRIAMYDDLARIERNYGCVAEYYRCMYEEQEEYEPTEEELAETEKQIHEYYEEIKRLNGEASAFVKELIDEWEYSKPQYAEWNAKAYYEILKWDKERTINIVARVADHYGVEVGKTWETYYRVPEGKYAISVEYHDYGRIKYKHIGNLDLETFKKVFRDLDEARLYPTMSHNGMFVSNSSLGDLLKNYIREG